MILYQKIAVPNFDLMVEEILNSVQEQVDEKLRYWDLPVEHFKKHTPIFMKYIEDSFYDLPILFRFYNSPPFEGIGPHVDNLPNAKNKIGFNFPLMNTKNTLMDYYTNPYDNVKMLFNRGFGGDHSQGIKDISRLTLIDSVEIDVPTLVRTDVYHSVRNPNDSYRLILGMKFIGTQFEQVFKHYSVTVAN